MRLNRPRWAKSTSPWNKRSSSGAPKKQTISLADINTNARGWASTGGQHDQVLNVIGRVSLRDGLLLFVAVLCVERGAADRRAPLPALAIAMYRCLLATGLTAAWMAATSRRLRLGGVRAAVGPGLALAAHFATWIPSLRFTSVALSTVTISHSRCGRPPARFSGVKPGRLVWTGIAVSVVEVLLLTGFGELDADAWIGMGLALIAAVLAAIYVAFGERLRDHRPWSYTTPVYAVAAVSCCCCAWAWLSPLLGYAARDWLLIVAITVIAQIGGHSLMNAVVHRPRPPWSARRSCSRRPARISWRRSSGPVRGPVVGTRLDRHVDRAGVRDLRLTALNARTGVCEIGADSHLDIVEHD